MRVTRSSRERLTDDLLSLVLLNLCASSDGVIGDRLKVAKLLFLASYQLFLSQTRALSFSFYRYHHGPFTTELYETWEELSWMGFLKIEPGPTGNILVTDVGQKAAQHYSGRLEAIGNQGVFQVFKNVSDTYCGLSTDELLREVYSMRVTPIGWQQQVSIGAAPSGCYFTCILDRDEARASLAVDQETINDFFNELPRARRPVDASEDAHKDLYNSVTRGIQAEKAGSPGRIVSLEDIRRKVQQG